MFGEYEKIVQAVKDKLDEYDFTDLLSDCYDLGLNDIYEIIDSIDSILYQYLEFDEDGTPLDDLSTDEIMEYLSKKYNVQFVEQTHYYMRYK